MLAVGFIDVQNDFMLPDGALYVPRADELIRRLVYLWQWAKYMDIPVFFTQDCHDGSEPEMKANGGPFPFHCMKNTFGQENIMEIPTGAALFQKRCYDVWDKYLGCPDHINRYISAVEEKSRITHVLLAGVATDYCVKAAALGFAERGVKVGVLTDMIAGVAQESIDVSINEMISKGVRLNPFDHIRTAL